MRTCVMWAYLWVVGLYLASSKALAQLITPVSQSRSVQAGSLTFASADFTVFDTNVSASGYASSASAYQNSAINSSSIIASGGASGAYQRGMGAVPLIPVHNAALRFKSRRPVRTL